MRRTLIAILSSIGVALALCAYYALRRFVFHGRVDALEVGLLFAIAIAAFWLLTWKDWAQSRNTQRGRELDDLASVEDELVKLVRKNDAFSFSRGNVPPASAALDYPWVVQCKTFDFNSGIAKVKLKRGSRIDEKSLRKQIKADLKGACGGWFLEPLVLGVVLETSDSQGWNVNLLIDHNYAAGVGIAWLIVIDEGTKRLSSAHFPRPLRTTCFYDEFKSHLLARGYVP